MIIKVFNKVIAVFAAAPHWVANYLSGRWTLTLDSYNASGSAKKGKNHRVSSCEIMGAIIHHSFYTHCDLRGNNSTREERSSHFKGSTWKVWSNMKLSFFSFVFFFFNAHEIKPSSLDIWWPIKPVCRCSFMVCRHAQGDKGFTAFHLYQHTVHSGWLN